MILFVFINRSLLTVRSLDARYARRKRTDLIGCELTHGIISLFIALI